MLHSLIVLPAFFPPSSPPVPPWLPHLQPGSTDCDRCKAINTTAFHDPDIEQFDCSSVLGCNTVACHFCSNAPSCANPDGDCYVSYQKFGTCCLVHGCTRDQSSGAGCDFCNEDEIGNQYPCPSPPPPPAPPESPPWAPPPSPPYSPPDSPPQPPPPDKPPSAPGAEGLAAWVVPVSASLGALALLGLLGAVVYWVRRRNEPERFLERDDAKMSELNLTNNEVRARDVHDGL